VREGACILTVTWQVIKGSGGADKKIILWDPKKGERLKTLEGRRLAKLFFLVSPRSPGERRVCVFNSGGERRRRPLHMCSLTFEKVAAIGSCRSPGVLTASFSRAAGVTTRSFCGKTLEGHRLAKLFFFGLPAQLTGGEA